MLNVLVSAVMPSAVIVIIAVCIPTAKPATGLAVKSTEVAAGIVAASAVFVTKSPVGSNDIDTFANGMLPVFARVNSTAVMSATS